MILDKPNRYWIYVVPSERRVFFPHYKGKRITKEEYLQHWGKWIVLDEKEKLDVLALKLDIIVELRWIYMIKYSRSVPEIGNLDKPTMYIFCDDYFIDKTWGRTFKFHDNRSPFLFFRYLEKQLLVYFSQAFQANLSLANA